jgi:hypothetical protein
MQMLIHALVLFLMLNLGVGMWWVMRGPTAADDKHPLSFIVRYWKRYG